MNTFDDNFWDTFAPKKTKPDENDKVGFHSTQSGVDPKLIRAMIGQESNGNAKATSWKGNAGLLQVSQDVINRFVKPEEFGTMDPYNTDVNLAAGTRYMKFLLDRYKGDKKRALAGYNAGEGRADDPDWWNQSLVWNNLRSVQKGQKPRGYEGSTRQYIDNISSKYDGNNISSKYDGQENQSFWDSFQPPSENSSVWDLGLTTSQTPPQSNPTQPLQTDQLPAGFSSEPDPAYLKSQGLISDGSDEAKKALEEYQKRVKEEFDRAKTPARREILQKRLETVDKQIKEMAKKTEVKSAPEFQPVEPKSPVFISDANQNSYFKVPDQQNLKPGESRYFHDDKTYILDDKGQIKDENPPPMPLTFKMDDGRTLLESGNQTGLQPGEIRVRDVSNDKGGNFIAVKKGDKYSLRREGEKPVQATPPSNKQSVKIPQAASNGNTASSAPKKIKLSDNEELTKSQNQDNVTEGELRYEDQRGDTYLINPVAGSIKDESLAETADVIQVKLVPKAQKIAIDVNMAKELYINQVADYLSKKYTGQINDQNPNGFEINFKQAQEWVRQKGVVDFDTKDKLPDSAFYTDGFDTPNNPATEKTYTLTKRNLRDLADFASESKVKLEDEALNQISIFGELSPEMVNSFKEKGLDLDKLKSERSDDYQLALTKGQVNQKSFEQYQKRYSQTEKDSYLVDLMAKKSVGMVPREIADSEIEKYKALKEQKRQELTAQATNSSNPEFSGVNLARIGNPNEVAFAPSEIDSEVNKYMQKMLNLYGSATNRENKIKQDEIAKAFSANRVANMSWGEYAKEMATTVPANVTRSALETAISGTWRGIALMAGSIDDVIDPTNTKNVEDYASYKIAENFSKYLRDYLPVDEDLVNAGGVTGFFAGDVPQGLGSSIGMIPGGYAKYAKTAIAVLSSLQMGGDAYREARAMGVSPAVAQKAALLQSPLGVTEIFGMGKILERLNKGNGATVWRKLFNEAWHQAIKEVPEEKLQEGGQTLAQNLIQKATYNPDKEWSDGVLKAMAAAGFSSFLSSAGVSILNTVRNRHIYNQLIKQEEKNGVVIQHYGENEVYAFGQKVPVNRETQPLIESFDNSRNGIEEIQMEIEAIKKENRRKPISEQRKAVERIRALRTEMEALQRRQNVIAKTIVEKGGIEVPNKTVGETLIDQSANETNQPEVKPILTPTTVMSFDENGNLLPPNNEDVSGKPEETPNQPLVGLTIETETAGQTKKGKVVEDRGNKLIVDFEDGSKSFVIKKKATVVNDENTPLSKNDEVGEIPVKNKEVVQSLPETTENKPDETTSNEGEKSATPAKPPTPVVQGIQLTAKTNNSSDSNTVSNATEIVKDAGGLDSKKEEQEFAQDVIEAKSGKEGSEATQAVHAVIEEYKPDEDKSERKFSSTQVDFPEKEANEVREFGKKLISDEDLHENGREDRPHFTTKFGLTTKDAERVRPLVENIKPFKVRLGKTFIFENDDFDVVNLGVENSPELENLNKIISDNLPNKDTHPNYVPHAALAYVKSGEGKKYIENSEMEGKEVEFNGLTFSGKDRNETFIPFGGKEDVAKIEETENETVADTQNSKESGEKTKLNLPPNDMKFGQKEILRIGEILDQNSQNETDKNEFNDLIKIVTAETGLNQKEVEEVSNKEFQKRKKKAESLPKGENKSKTKTEVTSDAQSNNTDRNDHRSDKSEESADVQGTEPKRGASEIRSDESGERDGNNELNDGRREKRPVISDESPARREDSAANDGESESEGNSDSSGDRVPERRGSDYLAPHNSLSREGSWRETAKRNLDIIELVKKLEAENRRATPEEQALLVKFTGWGASEIANNLFPGFQYWGEIRPEYAKEGWKELATRAKALFTPEELKTAARSTRNAHYTSESIIRGIWDAVAQFGFSGGKILEPGMGVGLFGVAAPESILNKSHYTGIERDSMTARIAKQILQNQAVLENDFVKQNLPDNFFDVAIGNPPFSDTKILNDPRYKKYRFMTHDYFFAKSIDKVRPGGILVFVTSKGTMDKTDPKMREYIAERADLLGAIRLPQTAFKENAGTEVVTDVLFFRKRMDDEIAAGEDWINLDEITAKNKQDEEHTGLVNEYFINHPEMVLGDHSFQGSMYRANEYTVIPREGNIDEQFQKAIENLPSAVYAETGKTEEIVRKTAERDWNPKEKKEGSLYIHDDGRLMRREFGSGVELKESAPISANEEKWLRSYINLRTALKQAQFDQLNSSEEDDTIWQKSLAELNRVYDNFVKKHGNILDFSTFERKTLKDDGTEVVNVYRRFRNNKVLNLDVESPLIEALETITEDGQIVKSAMLLGRTIKPPAKVEIKELSDALAVSLDTLGKLNLSHVAELYRKVRPEITKDDVIRELGDAVFETPSGEWQLADEYLSGFVVDKLEEAEAAAASDKRFQRNVDALLQVQPAPLETVDISATLGAAWVGPRYVSDFAREVLGFKSDSVGFEPLTNTWSVLGAEGKGSRTLREASNDWGTSDRSPNELLDAALNNKTVKVTFRDADGKTHTDVDASALANEKIKLMKEAFRRWIYSDAKRAADITEKYNRQYNNIAPRFFDGSHLSTPGLSSRYKLHPHQKRAVWRILQTGNTYLAHAVGAGKTLEMIVSGMEQKRLGLISKPMYVVPNHMLKQFSSEFLEAYPLANILVADENNFAKEKRQQFTAQAALNDLDAVVITHSAFGLIRTKAETADVVIDEMIDQMRAAIAELDETDRAEKRTIKDLENRIEKIEQKFGSLADATGKDDVINFEDLGVDFVYVDEAHEFRKLDFVTNRTNVKGIDPKGSQRSLDLLIKLRWLESQRPGRSAVLASGTPITNTLAELYSIMRYLDPAELDTADLSHFDAWSAQFGEAVADYEMNAAGNYEIVERFSRFVNIPELMKRVRKFMDVLTLKQLGSLINLPTIKGGQPEIVVVKATEAQSDYLKNELASRIKTSRQWKPSKDEPGNPDPLINIITDGRLAAIDMRFVDPHAENDPNSKLNLMIDKIIEKYRQYKDLGYTDKNTGEIDGVKGAAQIVFSAVGFGEQVAAKRGFDAKEWMIKRLTEAGIPLSEIAFMGDYKTATAKERMFREMRQGTKKILIGSPQNMGTGVNVQKRLMVEHYLSPPWYPSDVEQPDGRIIRQGNQNESIEIYRYATKGTYDSTAWAMIARKSRAIEQAMTGDDSQRNLEDVSESSQYEMASAVSAGDERAIKLAGLRRDIEKLERLRGAHGQEQKQLNYDRRSSERTIEYQKEKIEKFDSGLTALGRNFISNEEFSANIGNQKFDKRTDIGQAVKTAWISALQSNKGKAISTKKDIPVEIGKVLGKFSLKAIVNASSNGIKGQLKLSVGNTILDLTNNERGGLLKDEINDIDAVGLATRIYNALNSISKLRTESLNEIENQKRRIKQIDSKIGQPFADEQELYDKIAEYAQLQSEMAGEGATTNDGEEFLTKLSQDLASVAIEKVLNRHLAANPVFDTEVFFEPNTLKSVIGEENYLNFEGFKIAVNPNLKLTGNFALIQAETIRQLTENPGYFISRYFTKHGDKIINADKAKELFPLYNENRLENDKAVHAAASALSKLLFQKRLKELPKGSRIQLTAGGQGSGKSSAIANSSADLVYDSVMGSVEGNRQVIDLIRRNDHEGLLVFVYRPIENAVIGNLRRSLAEGRLVSDTNIVYGHFNSLNSFLKDTAEYASNNGFSIIINQIVENEGMREISLKTLTDLRYNNIEEVKERAKNAFQKEYEQGNYPESIKSEFQRLGQTGTSKNVRDETDSTSGTDSTPNSTETLKQIADNDLTENEITLEEMRNLVYVPFDDLLPNANIERFGDRIKVNPESHEIFRRAFEQARIESGQTKIGSTDTEDMFGAIFIPPETIARTVKILRDKATEAEKLGYSPEQVAVFNQHAEMLQEAGQRNTTAIIYILDKALPEELFHQADYLGAIEKSLLKRHDEASAQKLDASRITQILWQKHFSRFNEYNRLSPKMLKAVLRAEIAPLLVEISGVDLAKYGITKEERDDYLLTWFEGYAKQNGIDALDNFEREELNVQEFIEKIKEAQPVRQNGQTNEESFADDGNQGGETPRGPPSSGQGSDQRLSAGGKSTAVGETNLNQNDTNPVKNETQPGKNEKLASLPETLRRAGIEADDVVYEVFGDKAAQASAEKMLNDNGIEGAIKILRSIKEPDADHAILSFMIQRILLDKAAEIASANPTDAQNLRALALKLGREHTLKAVKSGRFTRAASVIQNSVEGVIFAVQGIVEDVYDENKSLSPAEWERIEAKAREGEAALAKIQALKKENLNQQRKIKRLEDEKDGKQKTRRTKASMESRKKIVDLIKDRNAARIDEIRQKLLKRFSPVALKNIIGTTARLDEVMKGTLEIAQKLEQKGESSENIFFQTGWERGKDGWWRHDLPGTFELKHKVLRSMLIRNTVEPLDAVLNAPELFSFYPELRDIGVAFEKLGENVSASFDADNQIIYLDNSYKWAGALALTLKFDGIALWNLKHEIQHAIQEIEGFTGGDSSARVGADAYWRKAGEVEARNAERRLDLSEEELTQKPISSTEDVPRSEQILEVEPFALKSVLDRDSGFDEETINDLAQVGAMFLINGLTSQTDYLPEDFHAEMLNEFGDAIGGDFQKIYEKAWAFRDEWLSDIRRERTREDVRRKYGEELEDWEIDDILGEKKEKAANRRALEVLHRVAANKATLSPGEKKLTSKIDEIAPSEEIANAAKILATGGTREKVYSGLDNISEVEKEKVYAQAVEVLSFARKMQDEKEESENPIIKEIEKIRTEIKEGKKRGKAETAEAMKKLRQFNKLMERLNKTASTPQAKQISDIIAERETDVNTAVFASMIAYRAALDDIYTILGISDKKQQREILRRANQVFEEAKIEFERRQSDLLQQIATAKEELRSIGDLQWQARQSSRQASAEIAKELERIKSGELSYRAGQVVDVLNASRTLMASFDLSAVLRQGGFFTLAKPELQKQAFANMFKSFSANQYGRAVQSIEEHPRFVLAQRAGIDFAEAGKGDTDHEEMYRGKHTLEKIPYLGKLLNTTVTGWSERTYTAFLDTQRMVIFDALAQELEASGLSFERNRKEFEKIANFINVATGRGTTPSSQLGKLLMELPFFAPRYTLSRLQLLNMTLNPVAYYNMPPAARKIVAKSAVRFYGTTAAILFIPALLGLVGFDPDDNDFLKIKIGNTHYDIFAGTLQPARAILRLVHSAIVTKGGQSNRVPGEFWYDIADLDKGIIPRFVRGKLSPLASLGWDAFSGKDFTGNEFHWDKAILSRLIPLTFSDIYEAAKLDGVVGVARSLPFSILGVGVNNYPERNERPKTEAEKLAVKAVAMKLTSKPQTAEEKAERQRIDEMTSRSRAGENVTAEVKQMADAGLIPKDKVADILSAKNKSYLVDKAENLSLEEFEAVFRAANSKEREELLPLLNKKMKNAEVDEKLTPENKKELEKLGGRVIGDVPMPDKVKAEFEKFDIKIPDVGEKITVKKGEKIKLSSDEYEKYRRQALERIYKKVQEKMDSDAYKDADDSKKEEMLNEAIRKARAKELKDTKRDLKKAPEFQGY